MDVDDRIRGLLDDYPTPPAGDARTLFQRGRRRRRARRAGVALGSVAVVAVATAGALQLLPADEVPTPVIAGLPTLDEAPDASAACTQNATEAAEVLVLVAEHAAGRARGLPGEALADEYRDVWHLAGALAESDPELQARVADLERREQQDDCGDGFAYPQVSDRTRVEVDRLRESYAREPDPTTYAAMNLLVVMAAEFAPSQVREPPPAGIPPTFPVHPDALLISHAAHDRLATATWQLEEADFEEVANLYHQWLSEPLAGGWEVVASDGRQTQQPGEATTGRARLEVSGYGMIGHVYIETTPPNDRIEVTVEFSEM
jgi:hypothetical protein